jgi:KaiC/GvpD/RAD55 family RecA-like ATPase
MNPMRLMSATELRSLDLPERTYLSHPLLAAGESALIWAPSGIGKSLFTLHWMSAIASGRNFGPWATSGGHPILLVDTEMALADIVERLRMALSTPYGAGAEDRLHIMSMSLPSGVASLTEPLDLADEDSVNQLIKTAKTLKCELLVIDNLTTASSSLECENDAVAMKAIVASVSRIKLAGIAVMLVHHSTKTGGNYRGSVSLEAPFELVMELTRVAQTPHLVLEAKVRKGRNGAIRCGQQWQWRLGDSGWETAEAEWDTFEGKVLEYARTKRYSQKRLLANDLGISASTLSKTAKRMISDGKLSQATWDSYFETASRETSWSH